jgi:hypothetical protein
LDKPPPAGYARWTGPLLAKALQDVDVQYIWRFLREHKIDLAARKSWCESNDPEFTAKAADVVGLYIDPPAKAIVLCVDEKPSIQALERAQGYLKLPNGCALTGQSHDYRRHGPPPCLPRSKSPPEDHCRAFKAAAPCRVPGIRMKRVVAAFPDRELHVIIDNLNTHEMRPLAQKAPERPFPFHTDPVFLAEPNRDLVFHSAGPIAERRIVHLGRGVTGAHRCFHRSLQRDSQAVRMDQEEGLPTAVQKSPYHPAVIPGTSVAD